MKTIGRPGYPWAPHEILWIEAALKLSASSRPAAFWDIADMTGRTVDAVETKAYLVKKALADAAVQVAWESSVGQIGRRIMVPGPAPNHPERRAA